MSAKVRPANMDGVSSPGITASFKELELEPGRYENPRQPAPKPDRSSCTTLERYEGHSSPGTDRFRPEARVPEAEKKKEKRRDMV